MKGKEKKMYDFKCEVVHYLKKEPIIIETSVYSSEYFELDKGTKTVKCKFTLKNYGLYNYMAFVSTIEKDKKKQTEKYFKGNLLWGFGESIPLNELEIKIKGYTNLGQIKKDFDL